MTQFGLWTFSGTFSKFKVELGYEALIFRWLFQGKCHPIFKKTTPGNQSVLSKQRLQTKIL